jgi:cellobiose phosphorylase
MMIPSACAHENKCIYENAGMYVHAYTWVFVSIGNTQKAGPDWFLLLSIALSLENS